MRLANCFKEVMREPDIRLPILSVSIHSGISDKELEDEDRDRKVWLSEDRSKYQGVRKGDLVYNMMRAWQGAFGCSTVDGLVSPAYVVLSPLKGVNSKFFELLLHTELYQQVIYGYSNGIADFRKRLYWDKGRYISVVLPSEREQKDIVEYCAYKTNKINKLIQDIEETLKKLVEYRSALISRVISEAEASKVENV